MRVLRWRSKTSGQLLVRRATVVAGPDRVVVGELAEREPAALQDLERACERLRMVPQQPRHLARRLPQELDEGLVRHLGRDQGWLGSGSPATVCGPGGRAGSGGRGKRVFELTASGESRLRDARRTLEKLWSPAKPVAAP